MRSSDFGHRATSEAISRRAHVMGSCYKPMNCYAYPPSRAWVEQIGAIDPGRVDESHGWLARDELHDVERALSIVLGLTH